MERPFFAPAREDSVFIRVNRLEWEAWMDALPRGGDDSELSFRRLARTFGVTVYRAECIVRGLFALSFLPRLTHLQNAEALLDIERIVTIGRALIGVDKEVYPFVDEGLELLFTPEKPNQALPEPAWVRRAIEEILRQFYEPAEDPEPAKESYHRGKNSVGLNTDALTAERINRLVEARAKKDKISREEAFKALIFEPTSAKVVVNLFQPEGSELAYLPGTGFITVPEGADFREIAPREESTYRPSDQLRAFVEGRDGTCRAPGCEVPAHRCQLDHVVEFERGGPTSSDNLHCLCAHHHNIKTDKRTFPLLHPVTGEVFWLNTDGTWEVTVPRGVVVPVEGNWALTVAEKMEQAHRARPRIRLPHVDSFDDVTA